MEGTAARTAEQMDSGLGGAVRRLNSAFQGIILSIGEALAPALIELADRFSEIGVSVSRFIDRNREIAVIVLSAATAITGIGTALIGVGAALNIASFALSGFCLLYTSPSPRDRG